MTSTPPILHSPRKPWLKRWHRMRETQRTEVQVLDSFASATHLVLSAVQLADWRGERRWQYHVSVSVRPPLHVSNDVLALMRLATMFGAAMHGEVARILREFDMLGAEEADGYVWSKVPEHE